eukprot:3904071-Amphidinium_carterae.2
MSLTRGISLNLVQMNMERHSCNAISGLCWLSVAAIHQLAIVNPVNFFERLLIGFSMCSAGLSTSVIRAEC